MSPSTRVKVSNRLDANTLVMQLINTKSVQSWVKIKDELYRNQRYDTVKPLKGLEKTAFTTFRPSYMYGQRRFFMQFFFSRISGKETIANDNNNTLFKYRVQRVFEKEDHEVIPI